MEVVSPSALESLERAQIDIQIATAHRYPRKPISEIKRNITSFATLDEETAESCFYVLPRGGKEIAGPSIRLAEIAITCFGNISAGAREIGNDGKNITVQAVCHDLENNVRIAIEVKRNIMDKNGKTYNEDMQTTTGNAARSIALRNAIFKVVPMALIRPAYDAARKVAIGDADTLVSRRTRAMDAFVKMGAFPDRVLAAIGKKSVEDMGLIELEKLQGIRTAIKDGDTTVDEAFPALVPVTTKIAIPKEDAPANPAAQAPATVAAPAAPAAPTSSAPAKPDAKPKKDKAAPVAPAAPVVPYTPIQLDGLEGPMIAIAELANRDKISWSELYNVLRAKNMIARSATGLDGLSDQAGQHLYDGWDAIAADIVLKRPQAAAAPEQAAS